MQKDDRIAVKQKDGKFRRGYFVETLGILGTTAVRYSPQGKIEEVTKDAVRPLEEITDEQVYDWATKRHEQIRQLVADYFEKCRPDYEYELEIEGGEVRLDGVSLVAVEIFVETIGKVTEFPGWQLTDFKYHASTREEPEDVTDIPVSEHRNTLDAVCALIKHVMARDIDGYFEAVGECQMEEELAS